MIPHDLVKGTVVGRHDWTSTLFSITVSAEVAPFQAGQFTKLALQNEQGDWIRKAYSIVNSPDIHLETNEPAASQIEFLIIHVKDGQLSPKLHRLHVGDTVWVGKQAAGFMTLDEIPEYAKELWLISSGTGIGPYLSMLSGPCLPFDTIVLVHAVRTQPDLVYRQHIEDQLQRYAGRLKYIPIVSRERVEGALSGRIPALIASGELEQAASVSFNPNQSFVYLCGNPEMIRDAKIALNDKGLTKHLRRKPGHVSSENYW
ncbi:ferredoxin--NADP reductase [Vibrio porteresiae]|uniref:ferredoxin--NADP(+) reductase n=1 Tax=Vibrio porteresiae DSM 19223 TaxID=1123496 RepID=A0ABZ0Q7P0_9VIBR|nr:ferredoxin--NADP reductase [Vibrio porteresiae]WPC72424.1 ferredoxin--NADP reductase [Vibrio porteresiae DSM 19223]